MTGSRRGGRVNDRNEIKLLVNIMAHVKSCPETLQDFALKAIKDSILHGRQALYSNGVRHPGAVDDEDVEIIRKVIYGLGSEDGLGVSREGAELLFEINSETASSENVPSWQIFFVKAITMYLLYKGESPNAIDDDEVQWLESQFVEGRSCYRNEVALLEYLEREVGSLPARLATLKDRMQAAQVAA